MPEFVHLHLHSEYSLLDGAIRFDRLAERLTETGMKSVAVTDHGCLFGAVQFFDKMEKAGVQPILGMEAYIAFPSMSDRSAGGKRYHLTLLARNEKGYHNLSRLSSAAFIEGFYYKPRIDRDLLAAHSEGLLIGSACLQGELSRHLLAGRRDKALEAVRFYQDIVGRDSFFIELMDHGIDDQKRVLPLLVELARETGAPVAATNDAHYLRREDHAAHEVLLCLQTRRVLSDPGRMRLEGSEFYVKSPLEMEKLFGWIPESLTNTVKLAEMCDFSLSQGDFLLPEFNLPEGEEDPGAYLSGLAYKGLAERLGRDLAEIETERLDHELGIIVDMGFPGYFLIVSELMRWARGEGIPVGPGRGSAAGSLVSFAVDITDINPLDHDLSFERFLNPARKEMPDIDLDVCCERRQEVITHILNTYGEDSVCQLITFSRIRNRSVVRDVARVMGMTFEEGDAIAKLVASAPRTESNQEFPLPEIVKKVPALSRMIKEDERVATLFKYGYTLENLARHSGVHAAGVIIAPGNLRDFVPLYKAKEGITTQYEKKSAEKIGLMKLDILGLRNVTVIRRAEKMVQRHHPDLKVASLPLDDEQTLKAIARGETVGVFQLESSGMRDTLRKIDVSSFNDVIAAVAIFRPGSMDMIDLYAMNKKGVESGSADFSIDYLHPDLEEILIPTYGVIIYQEQVMRIANKLAGMSMAEADILRSAMSKKVADVMSRMRKDFTDGAIGRGVSRKIAKKLFDLVEKFAGYGFNKSHAVSYGTLAYWTAWLKVHYPAEFLAACLTSEIGRIDRITPLIDECARLGVTVLPLSVNSSSVQFDVDDQGRIIYALSAIKNVGEGPSSAIVAARQETGDFVNIFDLCSRVGNGAMNQKVLESLIGAGATDCFGRTRAVLLASVEQAMSFGLTIRRHREAGQMSLFGGGGEDSVDLEEPELPEMDELAPDVMHRLERDLLGYYSSGHPLDAYADELEGLCTAPIETAATCGRKTITTAGLVSESRIIPTRRGNMAFVLIEGRSGSAEVVVFNDILEMYGSLLEPGNLILMDGEITERRGDVRFSARSIYPIAQVRQILRAGISISIDGANPHVEKLADAVELLMASPGRGDVSIMIKHPSGWKVSGRSRSIRVDPEPGLMSGLRDLLGEGVVLLTRGKGAVKL